MKKKNLLLMLIIVSLIITSCGKSDSVFGKETELSVDNFENNPHFAVVDFDLNTGFRLLGENEKYFVETKEGYVFLKSPHEFVKSLKLNSGDEFWWKPDVDISDTCYIEIYKGEEKSVKSIALVKISKDKDGSYKVEAIKEREVLKSNVSIDEIQSREKNIYSKFFGDK
ncbi:MAG: hypothetical protein ACLVME_03990 [Ezakiella coagulans]|uniref:hypothetical protein n=1 Tax=Ezakiella coagulans TaxID=46507 RepID=UPI00399A2442